MAPSREIEKLQRRWQENPLGLTFAPLAEAYRKEGMFADALELLDIGLAQHPNYVPAHIVRGRCLLDMQSDAEAERAFVRVTELDPENVIALKSLAEIAERSGRYSEAVARLERVLEFDRNNEEAEQQLGRVRAYLAMPTPGILPDEVRSPPVPVAEPAAPVLPEQPPRAEIIQEGVEVEVFQPVELTAAAASEYQLPDASETLSAGTSRVDYAEAAAEVIEIGEPTPSEPLPELAFESEASVSDSPPVVPEPIVDAFGVSDVAYESEPAPAEPELTLAEPPAPEVIVSEVAVPDAGPPEPAPTDTVIEDAEVEPVESEPDLVVTETMAEVFLRQGHRELALAVYTQLATRDPDNPRIREALEQLGGERKSSPAAGLSAFAAVITGGQSVRSFFERLLSARRPGAAGESAGLSLGAVFGEEGPPAAAPAEAGQAGPSFDEFYADPAGAGAPPPAPASASAGPGDDIEEFTSWLKGLKR